MKKIFIFFAVIVLVLAVLTLAKNAIARFALVKGVKAAVGLDTSIGNMDIGILKHYVDINELKVFNPAGFNEKVMADVPQMYISYQPGAFFKGAVHLNKLHLELKDFIVEKNQKGELNVNSIQGLKRERGQTQAPADKAKPKNKPRIKIDIFELKVGRVVYKDYSQTPVQTSEYRLNLNERYENITDIDALVTLIVGRALVNTAIAKLTELDFNSINKNISGILKGSEGIFKDVGKTGTDAVDTVTKQLESIFK